MATLSGLYEFFSFANMLREKIAEPLPEITAAVVSSAKELRSFTGFPIPVDAQFSDGVLYDWILLPAHTGDISDHQPELTAFLTAQHEKGAKIGSVCAGAQWLADTGLLNGRRATTHWNRIELFREKYPQIEWQAKQIIVDEGSLVTAGGIMAWQELALFIIGREISMELASLISKTMLIDSHRTMQSPYEFVEFPITQNDSVIAESQRWLHDNFNRTVTLDNLSERSFLQKRTYVRRFRKATNFTPIAYVQELRLKECKRLLEATPLSFEEITDCVGYKDTNSFRSLFIKRTGITPKQYREKFSLLN